MKKSKIKFNIVDFIIILCVVIAAVFLVKNYIIDDAVIEEKETVSLQYVIVADMVSEDLIDNVAPGDFVYDKKTGKEIGTVASCDTKSATYVGFSDDGTQTLSEIPGYRSLYITVEVTAKGELGSYSANNVPISAGREYELAFKNFYCIGNCISVEIIEVAG